MARFPEKTISGALVRVILLGKSVDTETIATISRTINAMDPRPDGPRCVTKLPIDANRVVTGLAEICDLVGCPTLV